MKIKLILLATLIFVGNTKVFFSQLNEFNTHRHQTDKKLMLTLGSWAGLNIIGSGIGWATSTNEQNKSFHQMNVMWNVVNLGLFIPGYLRAKNGKTKLSLFETLDEQRKTETVFLINAGLDLAYISSGLLLLNKITDDPVKQSQFSGFGNSIIIQGGFLLVLDWIAFSVHRVHSKKNLSPLLRQLELSDSGIGFKWNIGATNKSKIKFNKIL